MEAIVGNYLDGIISLEKKIRLSGQHRVTVLFEEDITFVKNKKIDTKSLVLDLYPTPPPFDAYKYAGRVNFDIDGVEFQRKIRDEE